MDLDPNISSFSQRTAKHQGSVISYKLKGLKEVKEGQYYYFINDSKQLYNLNAD